MPSNHFEHEVLILTLNDCPGRNVRKAIGPVYGTSVRSRNFAGNWLGSLRAIFGGRQKGYSKMVSKSRNDALAQLAEAAKARGANAVLGMRFDSGEFDSGPGQAMNEVTAYGTAVVLE
jgi:uncharacterized protein YbjQ (UPF0145 family)